MIPVRLIAAGVAVALVAAAFGWQHVQLQRARAEAATERAGRAQDRAAAAQAAASATTAARAEEQRRAAALQETVDAAHQESARARADAAAAADAGQRLRQRLAAATAAAGGCPAAGNPAAAAGSAPATAAADLLADVQRRLDEAADGIARFADDAAVAGAACERAYDALTEAPPRD